MESNVFASLPKTLAHELVNAYREIGRNYFERRWEPAELNGGKLCEIVYTILEGATSDNYATRASKPDNMVDACRALERKTSDPSRPGDRSLRILIPRLLPFLYEIRNNRGVGHVGGDVNPNHEDAEAVFTMASWVMAELVRIFHGTTLESAQALVEMLVQRKHPLVWESAGAKRVLNPALKASDQTLALLYSETPGLSTEKLCSWVEYSSLAMFKKRVLTPLHTARLIEYDSKNMRATITPLGAQHVETKLLPR